MQHRELLSLGRALAAELRFGWLPTGALLAFAVFAVARSDPLWRRLLPAAAWAGVAVVFGRTLRAEQSLVERMARILEPTAPEFIGPYCRIVTALHAALFAALAAWIVGLAIEGDDARWRAFVGVEAWLLLAAFEIGELLVRKIHFRHYGRNPFDRLLARAFPPDRTATGRRSLAHLRRVAEGSPSGDSPGCPRRGSSASGRRRG